MQQIKYKGILIDYQLISHQKLQARKEWQDIFKMIKGKNLQTRKPYPATFSFRFDEEINWFPDKQKMRSQSHETSFATNATETSLSGKEKARRRSKKITKWGSLLVKANI